jgi:hypothetical protein
MAIATPTVPNFTTLEAAMVLASGTTMGTLRTLDIKTCWGAWLYVRMGRRAATALTRQAYVMIRPTDDNALVLPDTRLDVVSQTIAAASNTVASGGASGSNTVTLTSATGFAVGDTICLHSDDSAANRVEFNRIVDITSSVLTVERNFRVSHNAGDRVTNLADVQKVWIPGGEFYEIRCVNNTGQAMVFAVDAATYVSDTIN